MIVLQGSEFNVTSARGLNLQLASRQLTVCPEVLFAGPQRNRLGKGRRGRLFIPANFFEVIPYILLVVRILRLARLISVGRPEARGIRCEYFVRQRDALGGLSKFKLGVGDDNAALPRIIRRLRVNAQRKVAKLAAQAGIDQLAHFFERNVDVVPSRSLGRRREDRLRQLVRFLHSRWQLDAADRACSLVLLPSRAP